MKGLLALLLSIFAAIAYSEENLLEKYREKFSEKNMGYSEEDMLRAQRIYDNHTKNALPEADKYIGRVKVGSDNVTFVKGEPDNATTPVLSQLSMPLQDRLYIFMSSSVPLHIWKTYAKSSYMKDNAIMVLRGCIGGCETFKPTMEFIKSIGDFTNIYIDPMLFKLYEVTEVPTFVYAKDVPRLGIGSEGNIDLIGGKVPEYKKSVGDWSFDYHMEELRK